MYCILLLTHKLNLEKISDKIWLKKIDLPYIIVYGDENIEDDYTYDKNKRHLVVKCPDTYEYLTLKLACAYKCIITIPEMQHITGIFKIDDDVVVNTHELHNYIKLPIKDDYVGHVHIIKNDALCTHHRNKVQNKILKNITFNLRLSKICYGPMYFLSRRALQIIVSKFSYHNFSIYSTDIFEDYTFGHILKKSGIDPVCIKMYTDHLNQFTEYNLIAFHDYDHTKDLLQIDTSINI